MMTLQFLTLVAVLFGCWICWSAVAARASRFDMLAIIASALWAPVWFTIGLTALIVVGSFLLPGRRRALGHASDFGGGHWPVHGVFPRRVSGWGYRPPRSPRWRRR